MQDVIGFEGGIGLKLAPPVTFLALCRKASLPADHLLDLGRFGIPAGSRILLMSRAAAGSLLVVASRLSTPQTYHAVSRAGFHGSVTGKTNEMPNLPVMQVVTG